MEEKFCWHTPQSGLAQPLMGSGRLLGLQLVNLQLVTACSCSESLHHHTESSALRRHRLIPWWPSRISSSASFCSKAGMPKRLPFSSMPLYRDDPSRSSYVRKVGLDEASPGCSTRRAGCIPRLFLVPASIFNSDQLRVGYSSNLKI